MLLVRPQRPSESANVRRKNVWMLTFAFPSPLVEVETEDVAAGEATEAASAVTVEDEAVETGSEGVVRAGIVAAEAEGRLLLTSPTRTPFPALVARSLD